MRVGASGFGFLLGAIGVGAVLGPALLRRSIRPGERRWLFGPYAVRGGVDLALAAASSPLVAGGSLVAYGMSTAIGIRAVYVVGGLLLLVAAMVGWRTPLEPAGLAGASSSTRSSKASPRPPSQRFGAVEREILNGE